ncbi:MAG TPA: BrnA antitoxin family protein [Burkholderiales bacterium]|nr:BrnA antitoxin family protein [Burkholderiales bacterium]
MKAKPKTPPKFKSEAAERAFWGRHDSTEYVDWSAGKRVTLAKLKPSTETISLRLPKHLLDTIRQMANSRDVPYQSLIKIWLQEHAGERR